MTPPPASSTAPADDRTRIDDLDGADVRVAIVGSGFSGIAMAIRLREAGIEDFVVLERGAGVGGTWHHNTYPGCACDVPSHLYSLSFAPNPEWSYTYSRQPEIRAYLERTATEHGIRPHVHLGTDVESAAWDEDAARWELTTSRGTLHARVLISGMGPLSEPRLPDVPGRDTFEGTTFHSARWDHDFDLRGKRVASIGTGASAIQYVPRIQGEVEQLYVFQRTAPWIVPHSNRPITDVERRIYRRLPAAQRLTRAATYVGRELLVPGFTRRPGLMKIPETLARSHIRKQVRDPELRAKVTPDYTIGCKRILPSNDWYPALAKPNVELVTGGVKEIRPRSVVGADGVEHEVDAIVYGTGFQVTDIPAGERVRGRDGVLLDDVWQGSPSAYMGSSVAGFPNLFFLLGPNTGLGHSSMVYMIESQVAHVMEALRTMDQRGAETVEVRREALDDYNAEIDARMDRTVWNTGCASWYIDETGRNATLWPDWTWRFRRNVGRFDPQRYELGRIAARVPVAA